MTPQRGVLPTLTEVIEPAAEAPPFTGTEAPLPPESLPLDTQAAAAASAHNVAETHVALTLKVLTALRPRIDALLEAHLHDVLAPQLARLASDAAQRARRELGAAMHALVDEAVTEALEQRRKP